ncbi:MAG: hypothetical protein GX376_00375 [Firmicutes bacterium]|nr:hypothetical protein [Bacillota bacterium]
MERTNYIVADASYEQRKNYEAVAHYNAQATVPLNLRNEKIPPAVFSIHCNPRCSIGYYMVYWGCDGDYIKFRCPHAPGKAVGVSWCSSSNYGTVIKINIKDDLKRFSIPHRT